VQTESLELGYLALPADGGPGLVVIHDVWGLSDHTRDTARRIASAGFVTLAVDLYRPLGPVEIREPGPFMRELSDPDLLATIQRGVDFLHAHPAVAGGRVGVTGFCMGGTYALFSGALVDGVAAVAPFYGILSHHHGLYHSDAGLDPKKKPREPLDAARDLRCPMLAFFGAEDVFIPLSDVRALEAATRTSPHSVEVRVYEGAGHAFMNDTRPAAYRPDSARDAFDRMVTFFRRELANLPLGPAYPAFPRDKPRRRPE
jgi:carboxymethylenebutenolidase